MVTEQLVMCGVPAVGISVRGVCCLPSACSLSLLEGKNFEGWKEQLSSFPGSLTSQHLKRLLSVQLVELLSMNYSSLLQVPAPLADARTL